MANNRLVFSGLDQLKAALRSLPANLAGESAKLVEGAANGAAVTIRGNYAAHRRTGNLQNHVVVEKKATGPFGAAYVVKSTARHAVLFEHGTQARHWSGGKNTGVMPPAPPTHAFIPAVIRKRRQMYDQLKDVLRRAGLQVTGEP
jgi:hypothetical protein